MSARIHFLAIMTALMIALGGCRDNMFTGNLTPVPPVHRVPIDVQGATILIDKDPIIETRDPNHVLRANEQRVPQQFRAAMENALKLAGFRIASKASEPHDLVAKLAIHVTENGENDIRQVYRCGLTSGAADGDRDSKATLVAQIDWAWPKGTFVDVFEVFEFATHNVATDVATSRHVIAHLRKARSKGEPVSPLLPGVAGDAGDAERP